MGVLVGEVLLAVTLDSALVIFLHDDVAFEGTEALFDKVKSAHWKPNTSRQFIHVAVGLEDVKYLVKLSITSVESNFNRNVRSILDSTDSRLGEVDVKAREPFP